MKIMFYGLLALYFIYTALVWVHKEPHFSMKYICNGKIGSIHHWIYPTPKQCQLKMYAIAQDLNQSCQKLVIEESYCGH
jgi:hypothetical protein